MPNMGGLGMCCCEGFGFRVQSQSGIGHRSQ